jgi:hypothetical protein
MHWGCVCVRDEGGGWSPDSSPPRAPLLSPPPFSPPFAPLLLQLAPPGYPQLANATSHDPSVPLVLMGDMNTLSPLDQACHTQDQVLQYLLHATVGGSLGVAVLGRGGGTVASTSAPCPSCTPSHATGTCMSCVCECVDGGGGRWGWGSALCTCVWAHVCGCVCLGSCVCVCGLMCVSGPICVGGCCAGSPQPPPAASPTLYIDKFLVPSRDGIDYSPMQTLLDG